MTCDDLGFKQKFVSPNKFISYFPMEWNITDESHDITNLTRSI
jgi:hypothetical protein